MKLLNKVKELITTYENNFNCKMCQKSTNITLKYKTDEVNKLYVECIHYRFEIIIGIDEECLDDYINKPSMLLFIKKF